LDAFSYDFLIGSGGDVSDANEFYLNVYANFGESAPDKFYDCRYNLVPTTGSNGGFTTVTFDPTDSFSASDITKGTQSWNLSPYDCPAVPADMVLSSPDSFIRVCAINLGDTSSNDTYLDGYFDNVVLDTKTKVTTFDFEAPFVDDVPPTVTVKDDVSTGFPYVYSAVSFKLFDEYLVDKLTLNGVEKDLTEIGRAHV